MSVMKPSVSRAVRPVRGLRVTDHAIIRRLERTNSRFHHEQKLLKIVAFGKVVAPKNKLRKLLNNEFREAAYYTDGSLVVVVSDKAVVTCYQWKPADWAEEVVS